MAPTRLQVIIRTNDGLGYRRMYASLGLNELNAIRFLHTLQAYSNGTVAIVR